jgi:hypothetical protein
VADKLFPWTEIVPEIEEEDDYIWQCVDTEITEDPNLVSWCYPGQFIVLAKVDFDGRSYILTQGFQVRANVTLDMTSALPNPLGFASTASVTFATSSQLNIPLFFASTANIQTVTKGKIAQVYHTEQHIQTDTTSHAQVERHFKSTASIKIWPATFVTFSTTTNIVTNASSTLTKFRWFGATANINFATISQASDGRPFGTLEINDTGDSRDLLDINDAGDSLKLEE